MSGLLLAQISFELSQIPLLLAIIVGGFILGYFVEYITLRISEHIGLSRHLHFGIERHLSRLGISANLIEFLGKVIKYVIYLITFLLVVGELRIEAASKFLEAILLLHQT